MSPRRRTLAAAPAATLAASMVLVLVGTAGAQAADVRRGRTAGNTVSARLSTLIEDLPIDDVAHSGYARTLFKTWIDEDGDGCDTREEVLKAEAVEPPTQGSSCTLTGGEWYSWYDEQYWTNKSDVDIDHVVPLGEVWTSGGFDWATARRTAYANDLGDDRTLEAVTDNVNESKGDRDPAHWMPPAASATCRYIDYWVAVKTRWQLTADDTELAALQNLAAGCPDDTLTVTIADS